MFKKIFFLYLAFSFPSVALSEMKNFDSWTVSCDEKLSTCQMMTTGQSDSNYQFLIYKGEDNEFSVVFLEKRNLIDVSKFEEEKTKVPIVVDIDNEFNFKEKAYIKEEGDDDLNFILSLEKETQKELFNKLESGSKLSVKIETPYNIEILEKFDLKGFKKAYKYLSVINDKNTYNNNPLIVSYEDKETFSYSVEDFIERYNNSMPDIDMGKVTLEEKLERRHGGYVYQYNLIKTNNESGFIVDSFGNNKMTSFVFLGTGDGNLESGLDIISSISRAIKSSNPQMTKKEEAKIFNGIDIANIKEGHSRNIIVNNIKYSLDVDGSLGIVFSFGIHKD